MGNINLGKMGKEKYVIKTGSGDYLKKRYPKLSNLAYRLSFVVDLKLARKFNSIKEADEVRKTCPFLEKCKVVKIEEDD